MLKLTTTRSLQEFLRKHFQRIGETTARRFLEYAKLGQKKNPKNLTGDDIVKLVSAMKSYEDFVSPDPTCLSPLGEDLLATGIKKELEISDNAIENGSAFVATLQRKPATYSGFPFIVEVGVASTKQIEGDAKIALFRFANKIPLLFDEASDVSWKVVNQLIDWRNYRVTPGETPLAIFVHVCSTKIPYKTVGKEFIADRPEVEHEILNAVREVARNLRLYLSKREHLAQEKRKVDVFAKYLPKVALFSTKLSRAKIEPDIKPLLKGLVKYGVEETSDDPVEEES
jgi:DNA topoisomerase-6 subunit B